VWVGVGIRWVLGGKLKQFAVFIKSSFPAPLHWQLGSLLYEIIYPSGMPGAQDLQDSLGQLSLNAGAGI